MDQELTYKWIQARLRELHSGTVSEQDLLRLKEIALENPFVADALEGFDSHPNGQHAQHLQALEQKIKLPRRERRRWLIPNLTVTAIAASVLVIIATYAVITRIQKDSEEAIFVFVAPDSLLTADTIDQILAMEADEREAKEDKPPASPPAAESSTPAHPSATNPAKEAIAPPPTRLEESDQTAIATSTEPGASGIVQPTMDIAVPAEDSKHVALDGVPITSKSEMAKAKADEGYYANQMSPDMMHSRISGQIKDTKTGTPLAAAKLAVSYTNQLFYADIQGQFELYLPEPEVVLHASYDGYADSAFVVHPGTENLALGLSPGVMIESMGKQSGTTKGPVSVYKNPAIEAHHHFARYIKASSVLQLATEPSSARRKVTAEFNLTKAGKPQDIRIIESSRDKTYDDEAVRLLRNSPDWVCPGGEYPCVRQYTFLFR